MHSTTCSVDGCEKSVEHVEWCEMHYTRFYRHGDPLILLRRKDRICSIDRCEKKANSRSWCTMHYTRWKRHGDPLARLNTEQGVQCSIDGCEKLPHAHGYCEMHWMRYWQHRDPLIVLRAPNGNGTVAGGGYKQVYSDGKRDLEHRKVMSKLLGRPLRTDEHVHHKDLNRLNNDPLNLEILSPAEHARRHHEMRRKAVYDAIIQSVKDDEHG